MTHNVRRLCNFGPFLLGMEVWPSGLLGAREPAHNPPP